MKTYNYRCPDCNHTLPEDEWKNLMDDDKVSNLLDIKFESVCNEYGDCSHVWVEVDEIYIECPNCKEEVLVELIND